ncbi:MAG: exodeoxyribonuclease VII large subunit [Planctomycetes bacterium]|nr:exodeoxyribonuclease VII large subunit [Planctomycetota bacterium]
MSFMGKSAAARPLSVLELNQLARDLLEEQLGDVCVCGEISRAIVQPSGHTYFNLKDAEASVACALFAGAARASRFKPVDGARVILRGTVSVYPARGSYQLVVRSIQPEGEGAIRQAFLALKAKLDAEGLTAPERKRALPFLPRSVGVVTSATGAAIEDIKKAIWKRFPGMPIVLAPARVQGAEAVAELCAALRRVDRHADVDVIIIGRGGGSVEDLWAFNDETLVRAIAATRLPVISAVGHEIDVTLADLVADVRAFTPTEGGERAVPALADLQQQLEAYETRSLRTLRRTLREFTFGLEAVRERLHHAARSVAMKRRPRLNTLFECLIGASPRRQWSAQQQRLERLRQQLYSLPLHCVATRKAVLERAAGSLMALNPLAVMARGFTLTRHADGRIVRSAGEVPVGSVISTLFASGVALRSQALAADSPGQQAPANL